MKHIIGLLLTAALPLCLAQSGCNIILMTENGEVKSPGYPAQYQNNLDCTTRIVVAAGAQITLQFTAFSLESHSTCRYDYLQIYDGSSSRKFCGSTRPPSVTSKTNEMTIKFKTDHSVVKAGFSATYSTIRGSSANPTAADGVIKSPGYPAQYNNNEECLTKITAAQGKRVHLHFTSFSLESHSTCGYDYLEINDGSSSKKYCGKIVPPSIMSTKNEMTIKFKTDGSVVDAGFSATYSTYDGNCVAHFTASNGTIKSPGYPAQYRDNLNCLTRITVAAGKQVNLNFTAFSLQSNSTCVYDYVEINDGLSAKKYCGKTVPHSIRSAKNEMIIKFKTDGAFVDAGFSATYTAVDHVVNINDQNCGKRSISQARVVGGVDAVKGAWPWQIGMFSKSGRFFCGGSLINPFWVVTAAHCVEDISSASDIFIRIGDLNLNNDDGTEQRIDVQNIHSHRKYDSSTIDYDIALLKLRRPAMVNDYVNTVCVPGENEIIPVNSKCYMTGWGKIKHPGNTHPDLQQASIRVMESRVCQSMLDKLGWGLHMTPQMLCAGDPGTNKDACHGDSGGPLVCLDSSTNKFVLHGVVSWGSARCNPTDVYGVFARVQSLRGWIEKIMREN